MSNKVASNRSAPRREPAASPVPKPVPVPVGARGGEDARFDRLVYERVRLGIMSALAVNEQLTFNELKALFEVSDGNLSAHARKLEEAGYIECSKSFEGRRPKSEYRLTPVGRKALHRYLEHIEAVIKATRKA
ncbi:MAG TPA: transcriptional regulator [Steroidobacteraceae bacterium]|nr:transcriptional regulator [Steroidobacteraceae bacterium]